MANICAIPRDRAPRSIAGGATENNDFMSILVESAREECSNLAGAARDYDSHNARDASATSNGIQI